ncbi:MAG: carbon-nitrogen hydrolase family protein [Lentisphaeria bacterium]|nr:carbon-nitrogen hydrolase family protein [Lentisphaeria bacterium]
MAKRCLIATLGPAAQSLDASLSYQQGVERMIAFWKRQIDPVLPTQPDLIVIPEASDRYSNLAADKRLEYYRVRKEQVRDFWCETARENHCYIAYSAARELPDGSWRNSTQIIDRQGQIAGIYNKNHLVVEEYTRFDILNGKDAPVIATDFGSVGCAICFDLNFAPIREKYMASRPDLILFSSMYHGGLMQATWAYSCQAHFVGAVCNNECAIINPIGQKIAASTNYFPFTSALVNLDCRVVHLDYNWEKLRALKHKYRRDVTINDPGQLGCVLVSSEHDAISVMDMIREFEIETWDDYYARALKHQNEHREP